MAEDNVRGPDREELEKILDDHVRPLLKADEGDVKIQTVATDGTVFVVFLGMCAGCPGATYTLDTLVEPTLKEHPKVKKVLLAPYDYQSDDWD